MGLFSKIFGFLFGNKKLKLLIVGLDNSGKTTIINWFKPKKASAMEIVPTIGFQVEEFSKHNIHFTVFDMSGQGKYRNVWEHYYADAQCIVWVIDASDKFRMVVVKDELTAMLEHQAIKNTKKPILFFANKMDIPGSLGALEICKSLELEQIKERSWHIVASNALTGQGLEEGMSWLTEQMK